METAPLSQLSSQLAPSFKIGTTELLNPKQKTTQTETSTQIRITYYKPGLDTNRKPIISYRITHNQESSGGLVPPLIPPLRDRSDTQSNTYLQSVDEKWTLYALELAKNKKFYKKPKPVQVKFKASSPTGATRTVPLAKSSQFPPADTLETHSKNPKLFLYKPEGFDVKSRQWKANAHIEYTGSSHYIPYNP